MLGHDQTKMSSPQAPRRADLSSRGKNDVAPNPLWQSLTTCCGTLQPKMSVSRSDDPSEQEADRVADRVMLMAEPLPALRHAPMASLQRKCACAASENDKCECDKSGIALQRTAASPAAPASETSSVHQVLQSPGRPLDGSTRSFMEGRFERDFSSVRIHTGDNAAASARAVKAQAYTVGGNIVFSAGQFRPDTSAGRRLIAHELAHTIQQSDFGAPGGVTLQRSPDPQPGQTPLSLNFGSAPDLLFFAEPFHPDAVDLNDPASVAGSRFVNESTIVAWAAQRIFNDVTLSGGTAEKERLVNHLRRGELDDLHALWHAHAISTARLVSPTGFGSSPATTQPQIQVIFPKDNPFSGSEAARVQWANYLVTHWEEVDEKLDDKATDLYVEKIDAALHTLRIPPGATLVKDSEQVKRIEDAPEKEQIPIGGGWGDTANVGFEWLSKRLKSTSTSSVVFEVIGHEGVYFEMSFGDFWATDPWTGKIATDVVANTKGLVIVGEFIKGFLTAMASPVLIVMDTVAKIVDLSTMAFAAQMKMAGYDVPYTCFSSTCRNYNDCVEEKSKQGAGTDDCKSAALKQALEEASIIIPIYRQGRECVVDGNAEACGGIAALAVGLAEGGVRKMSAGKAAKAETAGVKVAEAEMPGAKGSPSMTNVEFEKGVIREAIGRPRRGEPTFAESFKEPTAIEKPAEPRLEIKKPSQPKPPTATEIATETVVEERARQAGSELELGDGKHGVAVAGEAKEAGFQLCSSCSLVARKLAEIEKILPENSELRRHVAFLKNQATGFDAQIKSRPEFADQFSRDIAKGLEDISKTPVIDELLRMSVDDLKANRASLKSQVRGGLELQAEVSEVFAEAGQKGIRTDLPEGTQATGTTTKPRTAITEDAPMLAANLEKQIGPRPEGYEAHHIIPKGMKEAAEARQILEDAGIDINDPRNGVWLPKDTAVPNPAAVEIHSKVHTNRAIRVMTEQLREGAKDGPTGVASALRRIQLTLSDMRYER